MGKGKRKKELKKEEPKKEKQGGAMERPRSADCFAKNIAAMQSLGWDKSGMLERLKEVKEKVVKIDPQIVLQGVKNPLVTTYVGFSTRKLYEAMTRKKKIIKYVCVIEPDLGVFKHLIATEDISDLLLNKSFDFIIGITGEQLLAELFRTYTQPIDQSVTKTTMLQNMEIILDPFVYIDKKEEGNNYIALIQETIQQIRLSMGCSDDQFRRFEMMIENKKHMLEAWNANGLYGKFEKVPAIVLGGGPSLAGFMEEYKNNPKLKNSIIIAVDAVLHKLLSNDIRPHIVIRCERKLTNIFQGVTKEMTDGIYYAGYPWTPSEFFDLFNDKFYLFRQNGVCLFTGIKHAFVDGGVSSGNAALELAINLGCRDIVLAGIDMCFIGDKSHSEGTQVEFNLDKSKAKWSKVPTNSGKEATTIPVWERCRNEYMQSIDKWTRKGKMFNVYNTSEDGAIITLTRYRKWADLDMFDKEVDVKSLIEKHREKISPEETERFNKTVSDAKIKCEELLNLVNIAEGLMEDSKRTADREINKLVELVKSNAELEPYNLVKGIRQNQANLDKLWLNVSDSIDMNFKQKLYNEMLFRALIFDVMQLNLYHYENNTNRMLNATDYMDERCEAYYRFTKEFMLSAKIYLKEFIKLFS